MKKLLSLCLCGVILAAFPASASDVQVIANASVGVSEISSADLKDVFLGAKSSVGGADVEPVLAKSGAAHEAFLKTVVGKSEQGLANHFKSLVFTGKGSMPKAFASDADIVKYVTSTKGAIGYISGSADSGAAKKIAVK
jgi:ABC-type phosphate transport system substrate-binding protein